MSLFSRIFKPNPPKTTQGVSTVPSSVTREAESPSNTRKRFYTRGRKGPFIITDMIKDMDGDVAYVLTYFDPQTRLYKNLVVKVELFKMLFSRHRS